MSSQKVAIFWDYENCRPPSNVPGNAIVDNIRDIARGFGSITTFRAYVDLSEVIPNKSNIRSELQCSGVSLIDCPHNGQKEVADKMLLVDMMVYAMDNPAPSTLVLITGDRDFAYAVSVLRLRSYDVVLISPSLGHASLRYLASAVLNWTTDVLGRQVANVRKASPQKQSMQSEAVEQRDAPKLEISSDSGSANDLVSWANPAVGSTGAGRIGTAPRSIITPVTLRAGGFEALRQMCQIARRPVDIISQGSISLDDESTSFEHISLDDAASGSSSGAPSLESEFDVVDDFPMSRSPSVKRVGTSEREETGKSAVLSSYLRANATAFLPPRTEQGGVLNQTAIAGPMQVADIVPSSTSGTSDEGALSDPLWAARSTSRPVLVKPLPSGSADASGIPVADRSVPAVAESGTSTNLRSGFARPEPVPNGLIPSPPLSTTAETSGVKSKDRAATLPSFLRGKSPGAPQPPPRLPPSEFASLAKVLETFRLNGCPRPLHSAVASAMLAQEKSVYQKAGATRFKHYATLAKDKGLVILGEGTKTTDQWISLHPSWHGIPNVDASLVPSVSAR